MLPLEIIAFWDAEDKTLNISSKEMMALVYAIRAFPDNICNSRVDVFVDSQVMIGAWEGESPRSAWSESQRNSSWKSLNGNIHLSLHFFESCANKRRLSRSDARLSQESFASVESRFDGELDHFFDLMNLDCFTLPLSSVERCERVQSRYAYCTRYMYMTNPYVFPPFSLIGPMLRFLVQFGKPLTIIVPELSPRPYWWPELMVAVLEGSAQVFEEIG